MGLQKILSKDFIEDLFKALNIFTRGDRRKLLLITFFQSLLGFLDLVGIALVGLIGAIAIRGVQSSKPGDRVAKILKIFNLEVFNFRTQVTILAITAILFLTAKTFISIFITKKTIYFMSRKSGFLTTELFGKILQKPITFINEKSSQEVIYSLSTGITNITVGIVGSCILLISDLVLFLILFLGLVAVDSIMAFFTVLTYAIVIVTLYKVLQKKAKENGEMYSKYSIESSNFVVAALENFREIFVRNRKYFYFNKLRELRDNIALAEARIKYIPSISKYVVEIVFVLSIVAMASFQFMKNDAYHAISVLMLFISASTRLSPALLRMQQNLIAIRVARGSAGTTFDLIDSLSSEPLFKGIPIRYSRNYKGFNANIELNNISFRHSIKKEYILKDVSLEIKEGNFLAVIGPSGSGKSTLVDLILGILSPEKGKILISGNSPEIAIKKWPGAIAYVPQQISIIDGTIRENIILGYDSSEITDEQVWESIESVALLEFVNQHREGLDYHVGVRGSRLSGGQKQRLGLARALVSKPKLIVLDEATSALDSSTELAVTNEILRFRGQSTIIMIAHRLSSILSADQILYLKDGNLSVFGSFSELKSCLPEINNYDDLR